MRTDSLEDNRSTAARRSHEIDESLSRVDALSQRAHSWDLFGFESLPAQRVVDQVVPVARQLLECTRELLLSFASRGDLGADLETRCEDISFFALQEIAHLGHTVDGMHVEQGSGQILERCGRIRGRVMTACWALHDVLREGTNTRRTNDVRTAELHQGLKVRVKYTNFRAQLARAAANTGDDAFRRMRLVGTRVAMLIGSTEYRWFRVGDRVILRGLQSAILQWVGSSDKDPQGAENIWRDIEAFSELSRQINRRADIQEHDRRLLNRLDQHLRASSPGDVFGAEHHHWVTTLRGHHVELDGLISSASAQSVAVWQQCLARFHTAPETNVPTDETSVPSSPSSNCWAAAHQVG